MDAAAWIEHADDTLRAAEGVRASAGRRAVVELLAEQHCGLSAQEIVDRLGPDRSASTATVYRALQTLEKVGLVRRLDTKEVARYERVDPSGEHHHHVLFDDGTVEPFEDPALEAAIDGIGERLGLDLTGHEVILRAQRK